MEGYLTEPNISLDTQKVKINFNNSKRQPCFSGEVYFHTIKRVKEALENSGFNNLEVHELFASEKDMQHFKHMWGDENKIPYSFIVIGHKK